jgi:hypothetical protein
MASMSCGEQKKGRNLNLLFSPNLTASGSKFCLFFI